MSSLLTPAKIHRNPTSMAPRRILFVHPSLPGEGTESDPVLRRHLVRLAQKLPVVCCHLNSPSHPPPPGVLLHRMPHRRWYFPPTRGWLPYSRQFNQYLRTSHTVRHLDIGPADAILCSAHNHQPLVASAIAYRSGAPLHLLLHDAWDQSLTRSYAPVFRKAASILTVSRELAQHVTDSFGVNASLLPPIGEDPLPPPTTATESGPAGPLLGIAGTLSVEYFRQALALGPAVLAIGSPPYGLLSDRLSCVPRLTGNLDALHYLQRNCHALFVYQSGKDRTYSRFSFPSRLVDFAQTGLPIILRAPPDSTLGRWAIDHHWDTYIRGDDDQAGFLRSRLLFSDCGAWLTAAHATQALARGEFSARRIQMGLEHALGIEPVSDL